MFASSNFLALIHRIFLAFGCAIAVMMVTGIDTSIAEPKVTVIRDPALKQDAKGLDFEIGRALFDRQWAAAPSSTQAADGLGPLFNARGCVSCHSGGGRGVPFDRNGAVLPALMLKLGQDGMDANSDGDPVYGQQIQSGSVMGLPAEASATVTFEDHKAMLDDGTAVDLRKPILHLANFAYGPLAEMTAVSPRLASAINGLGLLERIPAAEILAWADPDDKNGDGISGRANRVIDPATGKMALGRFGWKAGQASLEAQDARALDLDIGLSNPLYPNAYGDCTEAESACLAMPNGASPQFENLEVPSSLMRLIDRFVSEAVLPTTKRSTDTRGSALFVSAGCEACHRADYHLAASNGVLARNIAPYTDLLLHDMGMGLADHILEGEASGSEWRTAPLWGIGVALRSSDAGLLHDGRARNLLEAILWHDGEAAQARKNVVAMLTADRQALIDFIGSL